MVGTNSCTLYLWKEAQAVSKANNIVGYAQCRDGQIAACCRTSRWRTRCEFCVDEATIVLR